MKHCVGCKTSKSLTLFYASTKTIDGVNRYCIVCCKVNRGTEAVKKRDKRVKISYRQLHRAKIEGIKADPDITLAKVFKRDRGICHLCGKWVMPSKASMDHIRPISKGGDHTWDNVGLTHILCNLKKGNRT